MSAREEPAGGRHDEPASEETPLLGNDLPPEIVPDKRFQYKVELYALLFIVVLDLAATLLTAPMTQIMQEIICKDLYPDALARDEEEDPCKSSEVLGKLAIITGWTAAFECIPPILSAIPYGLMADKYGRKPVLTLSMVGILLTSAWESLSLIWPDVFPLWSMWFGSLFTFIGGGPGMLIAMVWSMIADCFPLVRRTNVIYHVTAAVLVTSLVAGPITSCLMKISPWIPLITGLGMMACTVLLTLFMPETLKLREAADEQVRDGLPDSSRASEYPADAPSGKQTFWQQTLALMQNDVGHVWRFLAGSRTIMLLITAFSLCIIVSYLRVGLTLQYMVKRYGIDWSDGPLYLTIGSATQLVLVLIVLPLLSWVMTKKYGMDPITRDLWLARGSSLLICGGCLLVALSFRMAQFIIAYLIFSLGSAFPVLTRAVANAIVEPHTIGTLNTVIGMVEQVGLAFAAPLLSWLLRAGLRLGGVWEGLPYIGGAFLMAIGALIVFMFQIPKKTPQLHGE